LYLFISSSGLRLYFALLPLLFGIFLLYTSFSLSHVLFASGSCHLLIFLILGPYHFCLYYVIYMLALLGVSWIRSSRMSAFIAFCGLSGLPPFTLFWGKLLALVCLPSVLALLVLLISLCSLYPYLRCAIYVSSPSTTSPFHLLILILLPCLVPSFCSNF